MARLATALLTRTLLALALLTRTLLALALLYLLWRVFLRRMRRRRRGVESLGLPAGHRLLRLRLPPLAALAAPAARAARAARAAPSAVARRAAARAAAGTAIAARATARAAAAVARAATGAPHLLRPHNVPRRAPAQSYVRELVRNGVRLRLHSDDRALASPPGRWAECAYPPRSACQAAEEPGAAG